ncbi:MAG: hypothetical protein KatS3mg090_0201 [Patescibacteria group bacterium]|nr:MAG: hypothetical protein KatS3mg090_0201 [Patescibacteria group bacterium]
MELDPTYQYKQKLKELRPEEEDLWMNLIQQVNYQIDKIRKEGLQNDEAITIIISTIQNIIAQKNTEVETLLNLAQKLLNTTFTTLDELAGYFLENIEEIMNQTIEARGNGKFIFNFLTWKNYNEA